MSAQQTAGVDYLPQLNEAVAQLVTQPEIHRIVDALKQQLQHTAEPFVWSTIDLQSIAKPLPDDIKSCWIFVLKRDVPSGCHYHPNSIQHMVMIEGQGASTVGAVSRQMKPLGEQDEPLSDTWYVIPAGVPHEFFPTRSDVVVLSFHTCDADELEEISCDSGAARKYEMR